MYVCMYVCIWKAILVCILAEVYPITRFPMKKKKKKYSKWEHSLNQFLVVDNHVLIFLLLLFSLFLFIICAALMVE